MLLMDYLGAIALLVGYSTSLKNLEAATFDREYLHMLIPTCGDND
jgi:hypothetical protein